MKKIIVFILTFSLLFSITSANFEQNAIESFKNSPSYEDLEKIENPILRFCEAVYLEAYMRRDFYEMEKQVCGDFFDKKMEAEYLYKKSVLWDRWIY